MQEFVFTWRFVLWKIIKQTAEVFPTEETFSNHLLSSQILWCSGIASIVSAWTSIKKKNPSYTPACPLCPISKASARGRLIEQRERKHFLITLWDWSLTNSIWHPPSSGDFPYGIRAGFPLMISIELWQTYIWASHLKFNLLKFKINIFLLKRIITSYSPDFANTRQKKFIIAHLSPRILTAPKWCNVRCFIKPCGDACNLLNGK